MAAYGLCNKTSTIEGLATPTTILVLNEGVTIDFSADGHKVTVAGVDGLLRVGLELREGDAISGVEEVPVEVAPYQYKAPEGRKIGVVVLCKPFAIAPE